MPRKQVLCLPVSSPTKSKKSTISQYFSTTSCACCSNQTREGLCEACFNNRQTSMVILQNKVKSWEQSYDEIKKVSALTKFLINLFLAFSDLPVMLWKNK